MRIELALAVLIFLAVPHWAMAEKPKYSRSQCIVRVDIDWKSDIDDYEKSYVLWGMVRNFSFSFFEIYGPRVPSTTVPTESTDKIFFQFSKLCDRKHEITRTLLARILPELSIFLDYEVSTEVIQPGPKTSNAFGPFWTDGGGSYTPSDRAITICHPDPSCPEQPAD